jgi:hypothetical protein
LDGGPVLADIEGGTGFADPADEIAEAVEGEAGTAEPSYGRAAEEAIDLE